MPIPALIAVSGIVVVSAFRNRLESFARGSLASTGRRKIRLSPIPKGTIFYHGTNSEEEFDIPNGPAWFSTSLNVAKRFSTWHGDETSESRRVLKYMVRSRISKIINIDSNEEMEIMIRKIERWKGELDEASPIEMAESLCAAGYNGWNIPNNYGHGQSDTMLCNPKDWLDFVSLERIL